MTCHFQLSLSQDESRAVDPAKGAFIARLRRDGEQWESRIVELDAEHPMAHLFEPTMREDVRKFPILGPGTLLDEPPLTQLGWCLLQEKTVHDELMVMQDHDRLSFAGREFPSTPWKALLKQALVQARALDQAQTLDHTTYHPGAQAHRPRL